MPKFLVALKNWIVAHKLISIGIGVAAAAVLATSIAVPVAVSNRKFNIIWKNDDGQQLAAVQLKRGEMPEYPGQTPVKADTAEWDYSFSGWDKEISEVQGDQTYTATYSQVKQKYTVTWKNYNDELLKTDENVEYGTTPVYTGSTPTKDQTVDTVYTFDGWEEGVTSVTGNVTYHAKFASEARKYKVTFKDSDGTTTVHEKDYAINTVPVYDGDIPTQEDDGSYSFIFVGWDRPLEAVTSAGATYTAVYLKLELVGDVYYADSLVGDFTSLDLVIPEKCNGKDIVKIKGSAFVSKPLTSISFPSTVEEIGNDAFKTITTLTSLNIPGTLKTIGARAFQGCVNLKELTLNEGITTISESAFYSTGIQELVLPASLDLNGSVAVGEYAFAECVYLYSVTLNCKSSKVYSTSFYNCGSVTEVIATQGESQSGYLGDYCFRWYKTEDEITNERGTFTKDEATVETSYMGRVYYTPHNSTVKYLVSAFGPGDILHTGTADQIKKYAFYHNNYIETVIIGSDITAINNFAFDGCTSLTDLSFELGGEKKLNIIGQSAFRDVAYAGILTLPARAKNTGFDQYAFKGLHNLTGIEFEDNVSDGSNTCVDGVLYSYHGQTLYHYPSGKTATTFTVPETVTGLLAYNGIQNNNLTSVTFASKTKLDLGSYVVGGNNITSITFDKDVKLTLSWFPFNNIPQVETLVLPAKTECWGAAFGNMGFNSEKEVNVFFEGTDISNWRTTGNDNQKWYYSKGSYCNVYVYSEADPGSTEPLEKTQGYWHYVSGTPTVW